MHSYQPTRWTKSKLGRTETGFGECVKPYDRCGPNSTWRRWQATGTNSRTAWKTERLSRLVQSGSGDFKCMTSPVREKEVTHRFWSSWLQSEERESRTGEWSICRVLEIIKSTKFSVPAMMAVKTLASETKPWGSKKRGSENNTQVPVVTRGQIRVKMQVFNRIPKDKSAKRSSQINKSTRFKTST